MSGDGKENPIVTVGHIAAKATLGLVPGGSFLSAGYEMLHLLSKEVAEQIERRNEKRYQEFISSLFEGEVDPAVTEGLTVDDYQALLAACLADIEGEKAKVYGTAARAIGRKEISDNYKRFFILSISQLSLDQLNLLRRAYIANTFSLKPSQGAGSVHQQDILRVLGGVAAINYNSLESHGMVSESILTEFGSMMARACFDEPDLTPQSISAKEWRQEHLEIVFCGDSIGAVTNLTNAAWEHSFRSVNFSISILNRPRMYIPYHSLFLVIGEDANDIGAYKTEIDTLVNNRRVIVLDYGDNAELALELFPNHKRIGVKSLNGMLVREMAFEALLEDEQSGT